MGPFYPGCSALTEVLPPNRAQEVTTRNVISLLLPSTVLNTLILSVQVKSFLLDIQQEVELLAMYIMCKTVFQGDYICFPSRSIKRL